MKQELIDLTWTDPGDAPKPAAVLPGCRAGFWPANYGWVASGKRDISDAALADWLERLKHGYPQPGHESHVSPPPKDYSGPERMLFVDLEAGTGLANPHDQKVFEVEVARRYADSLYVVQRLREAGVANELHVFGLGLGTNYGETFAEPYWGSSIVRGRVRARLVNSRELVQACRCAWAAGYLTNAASVTRELAGIRNQIAEMRKAYPGVKVQVLIAGTYAADPWPRLPAAVLKRLVAAVKPADSAVLFGRWNDCEGLYGMLMQ